MSSNKDAAEVPELRRKAEKQLAARGVPPEESKDSEKPPEAPERTLHELRVHQIELEMQNDELRRIQEDLEISRDNYSHLFDFAPVGYITASEKGIIQTANLTLATMVSVQRKTLIGMPVSRLVFNDDRDLFHRHWQTLTKSTAIRSWSLRLAQKEGGNFFANLECLLVQDPRTGTTQIRMTVSDITKQKELENKLLQAQKMKSLATIAGGIAHQFNNALFLIVNNVELLEAHFPGDNTVGKYAKEVTKSAFHMAHLAAQLLAYARGGKYQSETVLLDQFVRKSVSATDGTVTAAVDLEVKSPSRMLGVKVDPIQMQMALSAVLANASEAMAGKGHIRVTCGHKAITEPTAKAFPGLKLGSYACLTVADSGEGMNEETRRQAFDPFFTTKLLGRGLGLAATYGIVKNHDGWISIDSEPGKGTVVSIYLPAITALGTGDTGKRLP